MLGFPDAIRGGGVWLWRQFTGLEWLLRGECVVDVVGVEERGGESNEE